MDIKVACCENIYNLHDIIPFIFTNVSHMWEICSQRKAFNVFGGAQVLGQLSCPPVCTPPTLLTLKYSFTEPRTWWRFSPLLFITLYVSLRKYRCGIGDIKAGPPPLLILQHAFPSVFRTWHANSITSGACVLPLNWIWNVCNMGSMTEWYLERPQSTLQ